MKHVIFIIWMFTFYSLSPLVYCQLQCSSSGEYLVISNKLAKKIIPDRSIHQPYEPDIQIPSVCNVSRTCSALVLEVLWEKHIWAPNVGRTRSFKLHGSETPLVIYGPTLYPSNCFNFFHVENLRMGALCIDRVRDEYLIVPYKIIYDDQGGLQHNQLGVQIHLNIERHSPFIVLNSTQKFEIIGINYYEHLASYKLFAIHFNDESSDIIDIPSECPGPHDIQPIGQSDAIIKCANGRILYFNVWDFTFTMLSSNNIEFISTCTNTMSFVLVQGIDSIIFNKSGVIYRLSVNASVNITSAVCHAFNEDDITFYFADGVSGAVYKLFLGDIVTASSRQAMFPQIVNRGINDNGAMVSLYIDGPILWGRQMLPNHSEVTVYITDLLTEKPSLPVSVSGPNVFVQLYTAEKCVSVTDPTEQPKSQNNSNGQISSNMGYIVGTVVAIAIILLIGIFILYIVHHYHKRRTQLRGRSTLQDNDDSLEMTQIGGQSTTNSEAALLEQYEIQNDGFSKDTTPIEEREQQEGSGELVSPSCRVPVNTPTKTVTNTSPSRLDEVD